MTPRRCAAQVVHGVDGSGRGAGVAGYERSARLVADDLDALLAIHREPVVHRIRVGNCVLRTTVGNCVLRTTVGNCVLRTTVGYCGDLRASGLRVERAHAVSASGRSNSGPCGRH